MINEFEWGNDVILAFAFEGLSINIKDGLDFLDFVFQLDDHLGIVLSLSTLQGVLLVELHQFFLCEIELLAELLKLKLILSLEQSSVLFIVGQQLS